jgi:hypothetical protein
MSDTNTTNIFLKLARARAALRRKALTPTGKNDFLRFKYFELADFLPDALNAFDAEGLTPVFSFDEKTAWLKIYDHIGDEYITVSVPVAAAVLKGKDPSPIQEMGAQQTYLRRYLYMAAMEITEHDALAGELQKAAKPQKGAPAPKDEAKPQHQAKQADAHTVSAAFKTFVPNITWADLEHIAGKKHAEWREPEIERLRARLKQLKVDAGEQQKKEASDGHQLGD